MRTGMSLIFAIVGVVVLFADAIVYGGFEHFLKGIAAAGLITFFCEKF